MAGPGRSVAPCGASPDGDTLASAGDDGVVRLWGSRDGTPLGEMHSHDGTIWGVAFSPDARTLASAGSDGKVRLWNMRSRKPEGQLPVGYMPAEPLAGPPESFAEQASAFLEAGFDTLIFWAIDPSPAHAINRGLAEARGKVVGVLIDGARIVTPGLLHFGIEFSAVDPDFLQPRFVAHVDDIEQRSGEHAGEKHFWRQIPVADGQCGNEGEIDRFLDGPMFTQADDYTEPDDQHEQG